MRRERIAEGEILEENEEFGVANLGLSKNEKMFCFVMHVS